MFSVEHSVPVNADLAPGAPALTRHHVWLGLVLKAEDAVPFVPAMSYCKVTGRFDNGLFRDIVFGGQAMTEKILFHPEEKVEFIRTAGIEMGTIVNQILEDETARSASASPSPWNARAWRMAAPRNGNSPTGWRAAI